MQSNPSYNIGIGGGLQDDYSQYSNYGTGGSSSSGRYHNQAGGGYDTEYRQQFHTSGGHQTTDDFSYYQRYKDNSGTLVVRSVYRPQFHKLPSCRTCLLHLVLQLCMHPVQFLFHKTGAKFTAIWVHLHDNIIGVKYSYVTLHSWDKCIHTSVLG